MVRLTNTKQLKVPIIANSAYERNYIWNRCEEAGIDDYIQKPFGENSISNILQKHYY
jgi:CheY-like chemotaxis protein